jgi:hypothetical protein
VLYVREAAARVELNGRPLQRALRSERNRRLLFASQASTRAGYLSMGALSMSRFSA